MRAVVVLVGHHHEVTVAQAAGRVVVLAVLQTENLFDVRDFLVLHDLVVRRLAHIQQLQKDTRVSARAPESQTRPRTLPRRGNTPK
jgi:hypothetical protein